MVVDSDAFPSRDRHRHWRVLDHLARHSAKEQRELRSERYLEREFFPESYGGKVITYLQRLADGLNRYFAGEAGERHEYRIEMLRGEAVDPAERYAIRWVLNERALRRLFWQPYLNQRLHTFIAYGVPLFTKSDDQALFMRRADVNLPADVASSGLSGEICWPFVAHGDLLAAVELNRWLSAHNISVAFKPFKADSDFSQLHKATSENANVIALGSTRVNGILEEYQNSRSRQMPTRRQRFCRSGCVSMMLFGWTIMTASSGTRSKRGGSVAAYRAYRSSSRVGQGQFKAR